MSRRGKAAVGSVRESWTPSGPSAVHGHDGVDESWLAGKRPIVRFFLIYAALAIPLLVIYYAYYEHSGILYHYLSLNAKASAVLLRCFGTPATADGLTVGSPRFGLRVAQGCDAVQPSILFLCAVLASPVAFRLKLPGILIGVPLLLVLNLVRIVSLCYVRIYFQALFELMHIEVWQALFIFLALLFWVLWARWAKGRTAKHAHVSA